MEATMSIVSCRYPLALALCVAFAATPALGDDAKRGGGQGTQAAPTQRPTIPQREPAGAEMRVSKLIGAAIHDAGGKKLGDVKDVVLDTDSGRIHYAVLSFGGLLGVGDKLFAVPLAKLRADKGRLILDATKEQIESAPGFDRSRWPDWKTGSYRAEVDRRYGATPADARAKFRRASEVLKSQVRDANGAEIGNIKDIVVDVPQTRVHYVVVEFDRAWNPRDKLVALPMSALGSVATAPPPSRNADSAAPPRNPPEVLSLETPGGPSRGTASAINPPPGVQTTPPAIDPKAGVARIDRPPLGTTTSYADDEDLYYRGTREQLKDAPEFDRHQYPDLRDASRRTEFDRRLSHW
jgi:sporulation protein YlmC with PRC-barrel domain